MQWLFKEGALEVKECNDSLRRERWKSNSAVIKEGVLEVKECSDSLRGEHWKSNNAVTL